MHLQTDTGTARQEDHPSRVSHQRDLRYSLELITVRCVRIQEKQMSSGSEDLSHSGNGGYLDFVTDDRDKNYVRFYVGQSLTILSRVDEHICRIEEGSCRTLHYYISQLGHGNRKPRF